MTSFIGIPLSQDEFEKCLIKEISFLQNGKTVRMKNFKEYKKYISENTVPESVNLILTVYFNFNNRYIFTDMNNTYFENFFTFTFSDEKNQIKLVDSPKFRGIYISLTKIGERSSIQHYSEFIEMANMLKEENIIGKTLSPFLYNI